MLIKENEFSNFILHSTSKKSHNTQKNNHPQTTGEQNFEHP